MTGKFTRTDLPATAYGWVRVTDLDTSTIDAWELPCGCMFYASKGQVPRIVTVWQEPDPQ